MENETFTQLESLVTLMTALATVAASMIAAWAVIEARRMREAHTSPEVIVYLERNDRVPRVVDLVITNTGAAAAYLVKFDVRGNQIPLDFMKRDSLYILRNGINFFAPGQLYRFSLNLFTDLPKDEISIDVCYFAKGEADHKPCRRESFTLRPRELEDFAEWTDWEKESNRAMKKGMDELAKAMYALRRGRITMNVILKDPPQSARPMTQEEFEAAWNSIDWDSDEETTGALPETASDQEQKV